MTVVVYRDGVIASDTLSTYGGTLFTEVQKIGKTAGGYLIGLCGGTIQCANIIRTASALDKNHSFEALVKTFSGDGDSFGMIVDPEGTIFTWGKDGAARCFSHWLSVGSGSDFAIGALSMGANSVEAVKIAKKYSTTCGGRVISYQLGKDPKIKVYI